MIHSVHNVNKQKHSCQLSPSPPTSPHSVRNSMTHQTIESIGLGPFLHHDMPGHLEYVHHILLTAETTRGPINHWAFSFKRRWRNAGKEDVEYAVSKAWSLVKLGQRVIILMLYMMDGTEGKDMNIDNYQWTWMEASRLNGTIHEGIIWLEQQIEVTAEVLYNYSNYIMYSQYFDQNPQVMFASNYVQTRPVHRVSYISPGPFPACTKCPFSLFAHLSSSLSLFSSVPLMHCDFHILTLRVFLERLLIHVHQTAPL